MSERFADYRVLVTGAASGIGAATVARFLAEGAVVTGADLHEEGLTRFAEEWGDGFRPVVADIATEDGRTRVIAAAGGAAGRLDVLVNNAAVFLFGGADATAEQWQRTVDVNLKAPAELVAQALPALRRASPRASVINVASASAHIAQSQRWTYNSSKGALLQLTRCQALDLAPEGIRVNSVSPAWVWTPVVDRAADGDRERWEKVWGEYIPMNRCGEPAEIAATIAFLASEDASFVTGADLPVDGGYLVVGGEGRTILDIQEG